MTNGYRDTTSRRQFLRGTLAAAGAVVMLGPRQILGGESESGGTVQGRPVHVVREIYVCPVKNQGLRNLPEALLGSEIQR